MDTGRILNLKKYLNMKKIIYNHQTNKLSELDLRMVRSVPSGGNWRNIPTTIPSKRLEQIRISGGRTTYYGRLRYEFPSYTISTCFHRPGNGCYIHPEDGSHGKKAQHRLISFREAARLQSFPDNYIFYGSKGSKLNQVGNAVPPLLSKAIADTIKGQTFIDLFCGAGGMSLGFLMAKKEIVGAIELEKYACETFKRNHDNKDILIEGDISEENNKKNFYIKVKKNLKGRDLDIIIGGPPCQGFSLAGKRILEDPRNALFKEYLAVLKYFRPKIFILENVPGLLSMHGGILIREIIESFSKIGYKVKQPIILNAEEFGVPQKRRRLFVVGHLPGILVNFPPKTLFAEKNEKTLPTITSVFDAISDLPPIYNGLGEEITEFNWKPLSDYQRFLSGNINFDEFYSSRKKEINY